MANPKTDAHSRATSFDLDIEAHDTSNAPESNVSTTNKFIVLAVYFALSLWITISNKSVLAKAPYPWLLTAIHAVATSIGCFGVLATGHIKLTRLTRSHHMTLLAFSFLFTLNIACSNVSLAMVSVPFHQILRSTLPLITILIYRFAYGQSYSTATYLTMIPLVFGIALSTAGDYYCTFLGFSLTFLGVVLSAVKAVATNRLMTGPLALSTMELLLRMSPLSALQCFAVALVNGEVTHLYAEYVNHTLHDGFHADVILNTLIAVGLNVVSFQSVKLLGALTTSVFGNVRQVLTILLGIMIFNVPVGFLSGIGMFITTIGAVWYSKIELDNRSS